MNPEILLHGYAGGIFYATFLYPLLRDMLSDGSTNMLGRMEGETGAMYLGRAIGAGLVWPLVVLYIVYRILSRHVVPWLTTPKR